jgi:hypothetical protein
MAWGWGERNVGLEVVDVQWEARWWREMEAAGSRLSGFFDKRQDAASTIPPPSH